MNKQKVLVYWNSELKLGRVVYGVSRMVPYVGVSRQTLENRLSADGCWINPPWVIFWIDQDKIERATKVNDSILEYNAKIVKNTTKYLKDDTESGILAPIIEKEDIKTEDVVQKLKVTSRKPKGKPKVQKFPPDLKMVKRFAPDHMPKEGEPLPVAPGMGDIINVGSANGLKLPDKPVDIPIDHNTNKWADAVKRQQDKDKGVKDKKIIEPVIDTELEKKLAEARKSESVKTNKMMETYLKESEELDKTEPDYLV